MKNLKLMVFIIISVIMIYSHSYSQTEIVEKSFRLGGSGSVIQMVWIPPGSFMMGAPGTQGAGDDEAPSHHVTLLKGFWMGKFEVTQSQWEAVMGPKTFYFEGHPNRPAESISWNDAKSFIATLNSFETGNPWRLPTEAEWEYACRAGHYNTRFWWGNDPIYSQLEGYAWINTNSNSHTHDVGTTTGNTPNPYGLWDMGGNVWEWCEDWYHWGYLGAPNDGSAWIDPPGTQRITRGGSWYFEGRRCLPTLRSLYEPNGRTATFGFRMVREPAIFSSFSADPTKGKIPLTIQFSDFSISDKPITSWSWDFDNDGTIDSNEQNPTWTYSEPGIYSVSLKVTFDTLSHTSIRENYIQAIGDEAALSFNGENSLVRCPATPSLNINQQFTLESWINPTAIGEQINTNIGEIFDKQNIMLSFINTHPVYNNHCLYLRMIHTDGSISLSFSPINSIKLDEWQHVAITFDGDSTVKMYINGIEQSLTYSGFPSGNITDHADKDLIFGCSQYQFFKFNGLMDEIRIWSFAQSSETIHTNKNRLINGDEPGLVGYWRMDEGEGEVIQDLSANGNHGIISNASWGIGVSLNPPTSIDEPIQEKRKTPKFTLLTNYPNPFNPHTTIIFELPEASYVFLAIYDIHGRLVKTLSENELWDVGIHSVLWNGKDNQDRKVGSGVYLSRLVAGKFYKTKKMMLVK